MKKINFLLVILLVLGLLGINVQAETDERATRVDAVRMLIYKIKIHTDADFETVKHIWNYEDLYDLEEIESKDDKEAWAEAIINGIVGGYEDGTYRPNAMLTRAEYAVMIKNASRFLEHNKIVEIQKLPYKDLSDWNAEAIKYCIERGYMLGYGDAFGADDDLLESQCDLVENRVVNGATAYEKQIVLSLAGKSPLKIEKVMNDLDLSPAEYDIIDDYYSFGRQPLGEASIYQFSNQYIWDACNFDYRTADDEFIKNQADKISRYKLLPPWEVETEIEKWTTYLTKLKENQVIRECFMVTDSSLCSTNHMLDGHTVRTVRGYVYFVYYSGSDDLLPKDQEVQSDIWYRQKVQIMVTKGVNREGLAIDFGGLAPAEPVPDELLN